MKPTKAAVFFLFILICLILINSLYITTITRELSDALDLANTDEYHDLSEKFKKHESFISLTVSHDDLTNIEELFAELIGAANANDEKGIITVKSRLKDSLEHLGRLSGINLDSIL